MPPVVPPPDWPAWAGIAASVGRDVESAEKILSGAVTRRISRGAGKQFDAERSARGAIESALHVRADAEHRRREDGKV